VKGAGLGNLNNSVLLINLSIHIEILIMTSKRYNITAIIYDKKGNILSIGKNSYKKTHPLQARYADKVGEPYKIYLHAEVDAITKCKDLDKAYKMVITRYDSNNNLGNACPCNICKHAISLTPIKIIEHT
jgi:deoxycytidylate deaminase